MSLGSIRKRPIRRRWAIGATTTVVAALVVLFVTSASGVLPGSPSTFESGNDPTLGLGNMTVDNLPVPPATPHTDWISVTGSPNYVHLTDAASSNTDDSFTPGQKQDTTCPDVTGHGNPPKDDFTDVASFTEVASVAPHAGETYLYGATIRFAANGNASENIELKQSSTLCPGSTVLTVRTAGDKLIAIDYKGGGSAVQFNILTWVTSGACFVSNDVAPCWGATVLPLDPNSAEGGVNATDLTAAQNPISGVPLVAGQFAEFGVNLALAGIIPAGSCKTFNQTVWESRSSGSSFVSSTKDIKIENKAINNCPNLAVHKVGSDGGLQTGAVFTLYAGTGTGGTVIGTCTVNAAGDCLPSFTGLNPGTYTIDETTVPAGYGKDPSLPKTFTLASGSGTTTLNFTDPALKGALAIVKNSTKGGAVKVAGAVFSYNGISVTDNGAGDENLAIGAVCVSNLVPGSYSVTETSPPAGYGAASGGAQSVTVVNGTNCGLNPPGAGATATFTNPPLSDIQVNFRDGGSGETSAVITCNNATGTTTTTPPSGWTTSKTVTGVNAPTTVTCTIVIDP